MTTPGISTRRRLIIFGGGSGIGLAAATLASQVGDDVTIADCDTAAVQLPIVAEGRCRFIPCDVTDPMQVRRSLAEASSEGWLNAVVTTVGGARVRKNLELDLDYWTRELTFNLTSTY